MKPIIAITPSMDGNFYKINSAYCGAVARAGGMPVILPYVHFEKLPFHGLLLSGGGDIHSHYFCQEIHPEASDISDARDAFELGLCKMALSQNIPILGICRGIQVLNTALGGDIIQNINNHSFPEERDKPIHPVTIKPGSQLSGIMGSVNAKVNSIHHQVVYRIGEGLQTSAMSPDGVIEAIEHKQKKFALGVQWHPECIYEEYPIHFSLFEAFIQAAMA